MKSNLIPILKKLLWLAVVAGIVAIVVLSFRTRPVIVDHGTVARDELVVTVQDDGFTRVRERFTVSAPIQGRLIRTPLRPGDAVHKGDTVVAVSNPLIRAATFTFGLAHRRPAGRRELQFAVGTSTKKKKE